MRDFIRLVEGMTLKEGGINTSEVDHMARKALADSLPKTIRSLLAVALPKLSPPRQNEHGYLDTSKIYDEFYEYCMENPQERMIDPLIDAFTDTLTNVVRQRLRQVIPTVASLEYEIMRRGYGDDPESYAADYARRFVVFIAVKDPKDESRSLGYFSSYDNKVMVFVEQDAFLYAGLNLVAEEILGESEDGLKHMLNYIVPIFVHEYAHVEQNLRAGKSQEYKDFGYITTGTTGRRGKGKRGGLIRGTDTNAAYLRYKGNVDEIDAFASGAAAELMQDQMHTAAHGLGSSGSVDWNNHISEIQRDLAAGYNTHGSSYAGYVQLLRDTFDGAYADLGLKPEQMEKVWRRFNKLVVQKLDKYRRPDHPAHPLDQHVSASFSETIKALARDTAAKIDPQDYNLRERVLNGALTSAAEEFISHRLFKFSWEEQPMLTKTIQVFRKLVLNYIPQSA